MQLASQGTTAKVKEEDIITISIYLGCINGPFLLGPIISTTIDDKTIFTTSRKSE